MNNFYHEFSIGFNWWYLILPLTMLLVGFLGTRRYYFEPQTTRIKTRGKKLSNVILVTTLVADFAVTTLVAIESSHGVIQFFTNLLAKDDSATWAMLLAGMVLLLGVPYVVFTLLVAMTKAGQYYQLGRLTEKRAEIRRHITPIERFVNR